MSAINTSMADRKKAERDAKREQAQIEKAARAASSDKARAAAWVRKSVAVDQEIIDAMEQVCKRERKLFSQLAREFFLTGLAQKGIALSDEPQ